MEFTLALEFTFSSQPNIGSTVLLTNGKKAKIIFVTEKYSRPTVTLLEDNSVLALKDEKDIKIAAVL